MKSLVAPSESTRDFRAARNRRRLRWKWYVSWGFLKGTYLGHNRGPPPCIIEWPGLDRSATGLGSAEVNETVNYPGKLSGNSLISG